MKLANKKIGDGVRVDGHNWKIVKDLGTQWKVQRKLNEYSMENTWISKPATKTPAEISDMESINPELAKLWKKQGGSVLSK